MIPEELIIIGIITLFVLGVILVIKTYRKKTRSYKICPECYRSLHITKTAESDSQVYSCVKHGPVLKESIEKCKCGNDLLIMEEAGHNTRYFICKDHGFIRQEKI